MKYTIDKVPVVEGRIGVTLQTPVIVAKQPVVFETCPDGIFQDFLTPSYWPGRRIVVRGRISPSTRTRRSHLSDLFRLVFTVYGLARAMAFV